MKKRLLLILLFVLIFSIGVNALTVSLTSPVNEKIETITNNIVFECSYSDGSAESARLYADFGGVWGINQTKYPPFTNNKVTFSVTVPNGAYKWNCGIIDSTPSLNSAPSNYSLTVQASNAKPVFTINDPILNYSWYSNESKLNVFDLDSYFTDPENDPLTFTATVTGSNDIIVEINPTTHVVSFKHTVGFTGTQTAYFTANDGHGNSNSSNIFGLTVKTAAINNKPSVGSIPNQEKTVGSSWTLDLTSYGSDTEDGSALTWSATSYNTSFLTVSISSKVATLTHLGSAIGSAIVNFKATDSGGLSDNKNITVNIIAQSSGGNQTNEGTGGGTGSDEGSGSEATTGGEEEELLDEFESSAYPPEIESFSPEEVDLLISGRKSLMFRINAEDADFDTLNYEWFLDGNKIDNEGESYFLERETLEDNKSYVLSVSVSDGANTATHSWNVKVSKEVQDDVELTTESNVSKGIGNVTGFFALKNTFTNTFKNVLDKVNGVFIIIGAAVLVLLIGGGVYYTKRKKSHFHRGVIESGFKMTKDQSKLGEFKKESEAKEIKDKAKHIKEIKEDVPAPLQDFIKKRMNWGESKESIKKSLEEKGWSEEQIKDTFKDIK